MGLFRVLRRAFPLSGCVVAALLVAQAPPAVHRFLQPYGEAGSKVAVTGFVVRRNDKYFAIQLADLRILRLRIGPETRGYINGRTVGLDEYKLGDVVRVDALSEGRGFLTAASIAWERSGTPEERARVSQSPEWRRPNTIRADPVDPNADDRKLSLFMRAPAPAYSPEMDEPTIQGAREKVQSLLDELPNFTVSTITHSFLSSTRPPSWKANGVVTAEVRYLDGGESQHNVRIDGRPQPEALYEDELADRIRESGKAGSIGEFGAVLSCIFSPYAMTNFHYLTMEHTGSHTALVYSLSIDHRNSCFGVLSGSQVAYPRWQGSIAVDKNSQDVIRLELEATDIPAEFPYDRAERRIEYGRVKIGSAYYQMPISAYWFGCYRATYDCWMNRIEFHDYGQFKTDSTIRFEEPK